MNRFPNTPDYEFVSMELMPKKKAYIGGKISGLPENEVMQKFIKKHAELEALGYEVYNPVLIIKSYNRSLQQRGLEPLTDVNNRKEIMRTCIRILLQCDELHLLPDWKDSAGALDERTQAQKYGIDIVYPQ